MADEDDNKADEGGKKRAFDPKMLVVGLVVAGAAVWFFLLRSAPVDPEAEAAASAEEMEAEPAIGEIIAAEAMTVNLEADELAFARVGAALVLSEEAIADEVTPWMPLFMDRAISVVAAWGPAELRTVDGHERLRAQLTDAAMEVWTDGQVNRVVLTELLVQ